LGTAPRAGTTIYVVQNQGSGRQTAPIPVVITEVRNEIGPGRSASPNKIVTFTATTSNGRGGTNTTANTITWRPPGG